MGWLRNIWHKFRRWVMVNFTAKDSGYFRVYVDGVEVSKHVAEREALESGTNAKRNNPGSEVWVEHDYRVDIGDPDIEPPVEEEPPIEEEEPEEPPVEEEPDMNTGENTGEGSGVLPLVTPTNFVITDGSQTQNRVDVTWTAPLRGRATEYHVKDATGTLGTIAWPATGMTVTGLTAATTYTLWVVTSDGITESSPSNTDSFNTNPVGSGPTVLFHRDFEGGVLGAIATSDPSGLDSQVGDASRNAFDNTHFHTGSKSVKITTSAGGVNFGGSINIPQLTQGQEGWFTQWHYYPSSWIEEDANPTGGSDVRKYWRVGRGGGGGWISYYLQQSTDKLMFDFGPDPIYFNSVNAPRDCELGGYGCLTTTNGFSPNSLCPVPPLDKWFATEIYIYATNTRSDPAAPYGYNAMWWYYDDTPGVDSNILLRATTAKTLGPTGTINSVVIGNIWGGQDGAGFTQSFWADNVFGVSANPAQTDNLGNPCNGNWTP